MPLLASERLNHKVICRAVSSFDLESKAVDVVVARYAFGLYLALVTDEQDGCLLG